jgi:membrane-anchored protein YejM (alkaline phosphatase superfamily)
MNRKSPLKNTLRIGFLYFLLSTVLLAVVFFSYILRSASLDFMDLGGWIYFVASCLSHAAIFAVLPFLLLFLPAALLGAGPKVSGTLMCIGEVLLVVGFIINGFVYGLYHFHINGLVISMLTGPGAGDIFVFSPWIYLKGTLYILAIIAVCAALLWLAIRRVTLNTQPPHLFRNGLLALLKLTLLAQGMHIYAAATMKRSVLEATGFLPYYFPIRMNSTLDKWGLIDGDKLSLMQFDDGGGEGNVSYPLNPLDVQAPDEPLNIVIFGVDSWNYRTMTRDCVPNIYALADSAEMYTDHFSSSNGTRGGLFGLFTGVSSYYWDSFERGNIQPLLVSELRRQGYHVQAYPSATLADPPFAKMFFAGVEGLNTDTEGKTVFERDCQITRNFIADLDKRAASSASQSADSVSPSKQPFFSFVFYDLPHAIQIPKDHLYHFQPSWEYADYMQLGNDDDPTPFFNLYRNCVWTVDSLIGEGIRALKEHDLLKNTVIVITGDHGQEFNENHKNYWGHWANYSRPQTGVPMVYYYPGCEPRQYKHRTTHYDISATLLRQVLGVKNPPEDFSMGYDLQDPTPRDWHVVGNDLFYAFILNDGTIVEKRGAGNIVIFDKVMNQLDDYPLNAKQLNDAILRLNRFYKK